VGTPPMLHRNATVITSFRAVQVIREKRLFSAGICHHLLISRTPSGVSSGGTHLYFGKPTD
jgi:hypothetical protein